MARPPSVIVLMPRPYHAITTTAATSESGIAVRLMNVVRKFQRKRNRTTVTITAPSASAAFTLPIARSMKSACWNALVSIVTSGGSPAFIPASVASIRWVTSSVFACGCFWIVATTAGRVLKLPSPRL